MANYTSAVIEIIRTYPIIFALTVLLPFLGGIVGAYVGWDSLKSRFEDNKIKIETESKISTLGVSHKKLETENEKLKQHQERALRIKLIIDKTKNGSRSAYNELDQIYVTYPDLTSEERGIIEEGYNDFRRVLANYILSKSSVGLIDLTTKQSRKWSLEYLFYALSYDNDIDLRIAAAKEIGNRKHEYLVKELYDIAVNGENIFLSLIAGEAVCKITDYAPYRQKKTILNKYQTSNLSMMPLNLNI